MSYWLRIKPVQRARAVSADAIARHAVALLDEHGIDALSLRTVAGRLGVAPASLYSRLDGVDDILDLALDHALDLASPEGSTTGHIDLLTAYYEHLLAHPWTVRVTALRPPRGPAHLRLSEALCRRLQADGVTDVLTTAYAMSNFVIGCATTAQAAAREPHTRANPSTAPLYEQLRAIYEHGPHHVVTAGLVALRRMAT